MRCILALCLVCLVTTTGLAKSESVAVGGEFFAPAPVQALETSPAEDVATAADLTVKATRKAVRNFRSHRRRTFFMRRAERTQVRAVRAQAIADAAAINADAASEP